MTRYALMDADRNDRATVERYLPENYRVVGTIRTPSGTEGLSVAWSASHLLVIAGEDNAGWTLEDYVIPRLASGLHFAEEVEQIPVVLPHSEVAMAMRVAGRRAWLTLSDDLRMAQIWLLEADGLAPFSAPVTLGEAGIMSAGVIA